MLYSYIKFVVKINIRVLISFKKVKNLVQLRAMMMFPFPLLVCGVFCSLVLRLCPVLIKVILVSVDWFGSYFWVKVMLSLYLITGI
jgi:hypothetical protein